MAKKSASDRDKQLRDELNDLLRAGSAPTNVDPINEEVPSLDITMEPMSMDKVQTAPPMNITELDNKFKKQARSIIQSMYDFYFDYGVLSKPEYIEKKNSIDSMGLSTMLFNIKSIKFVITRIIDEINAGNMNPKLIENFAALSAQMANLTKDQANYMLFLEESAKKAKLETMDYESNKTRSLNVAKKEVPIEDVEEIKEEQTKDEEKSKFFLTSDPMILVDTIHKTDMSYDSVKEQRSDYLKERGDVKKYVDYSNKNDLVQEYDVDATTIIDDESQNDDSDLLDMI